MSHMGSVPRLKEVYLTDVLGGKFNGAILARIVSLACHLVVVEI